MTSVQNVPERWQSRFDFFHTYGYPSSTPESQAAFRSLPFAQRMRLSFNPLAFLFGGIYFLVMGMWRKGLSALGLSLAVGVALVVVGAPASFELPVAAALGGLWAATANYAYYMDVTRNSSSWNPWEGMGKAR